jgi:1,2-diacylglycerol 3-alpha-glucosyltransferase
LKIAFVTNTYEPIIGGVAVSVKSFCDSLSDIGHQVYILAPNFSNYWDTNPNVFRISSVTTNYRMKYPLPYNCNGQLSQILKDLRINIVHSHHPLWLGMSALSVSRELNIPIVFTYHTMYEEYAHYMPFHNIFGLKDRLQRRAIGYADSCNLVITPTTAIKKILKSRGCKSPIAVLPTGISQHLTVPKESSVFDGIFNRYRITSQDTIFLCVTRLAKEKNCDFLISVSLELINHMPTAKILIIGDGHRKNELIKVVREKERQDNILFVGDVPYKDMACFYRIANLLLFVSQSETQGLPLTEALKFGLPIVALESPATNELVGKLKTGLVVKGDESEFVKTILELMDQPRLLRHYAQFNMSMAERFRMIDMSNKLIEIYKSVLSN